MRKLLDSSVINVIGIPDIKQKANPILRLFFNPIRVPTIEPHIVPSISAKADTMRFIKMSPGKYFIKILIIKNEKDKVLNNAISDIKLRV